MLLEDVGNVAAFAASDHARTSPLRPSTSRAARSWPEPAPDRVAARLVPPAYCVSTSTSSAVSRGRAAREATAAAGSAGRRRCQSVAAWYAPTSASRRSSA